MTAMRDNKAFTRGDPVSRSLIDVAADRAQLAPGRLPAGLVELGQRHGLISILSDLTDDPMVRAIAARERARSRVLEAHLGDLLERLHESGVQTAVLKGPAIAARYRMPAHRSFSDLDLLVPEPQVEMALDLLASYPATLSIPEKRPKADKRDVVLKDRSGVVFNVDVHWDLFSYSQLRGSADGATERAWAEARPILDSPFGPQWAIADTYRTGFLCTHAVLDHRFRLILFRDLLELSRGPVDWEAIAGAAAKWGLRSTTYLALWLTRKGLDAPIPDDLLATLRPRSLPISYLEWALPRADLVRFDGHRPHPINLASVLLNDSRWGRTSLLLRAPSAVPNWRRRVAKDPQSSQTPRVLILVSTDRRRGAEVFTERLRDGLASLGWVVEAIALRAYGEEPRADVEALVGPDGGSGGRFDLRVARGLRSKVRTFQPDVVVANGGATLRYAFADDLGRRYKLTYIGIGEPHYWLRSRLSRWLNRLMLRRVDQILAVSNATGKQLIELEPAIENRLSTVYTGVPDELFELPVALPDGPMKVLMIGSLTPEKAPDLALRVVSKIPEARLRFVGDGPLRGELELEARHLRMADRVEFIGPVTDVNPHLVWAHLLILTSLSEGLPGAILEAGAAGVPTVAVDVGGVREAVEDGVGGLVAGPGGEGLLEALTALDADRERLAQMGKSAREHAMSHFHMDDVIRRYADVLTSVIR
jgi:glycosyltransferase involved in cell wall biosynthesis